MDIKRFIHEHYLLFDEYKKQEACCDKCNQQIDGWAYSCERCKFWLHDSCAQQQLPAQISAHPLHSQHNLNLFCLYKSDYICGKCFNLSRGHRYHCRDCDFNLEYLCAFSTNVEKNRPIINGDRSKNIDHFSYDKPLTLFNYRRVGKYDYCCSWCEKHLFGISYGSLAGSRNIMFHDYCLNNMPSIIWKHPFHPSHPLQICNFHFRSQYCNACNKLIRKREKSYFCPKCKFHLHVLCARLRPNLKVELHEHHLTYFQITSHRTTFLCKTCNCNCGAGDEESVFYRCVQCNFSYHFNCLGILFSTTHKYHRHDLMLVDSFIEDDSKEYYCDICEEERKPNHQVYGCKKCKYVAHIECALNKAVDVKLDHGSVSGLLDNKASALEVVEQEEEEQRHAKFPTHLNIECVGHPHFLSYNEAIKQNKSLLCNACCQEIFYQHYACEDCEYYLHKTCTTLPYEVSHLLHRQHPLKLFTNIGAFTCYQCRDHSDGFVYICYPCDFKLDVKCATAPIAPNTKDQRLVKMERLYKSCAVNQNHKLEFFNLIRSNLPILKCNACHIPIMGPAYICHDCSYTVLHDSCLARLREMQHPFHPLHPLHPQFIKSEYCSGCKCIIDFSIGYSCRQCNFHLHLDCADSLKLALKLKYHQHNLYYFGPDTKRRSSRCEQCRFAVGGAPFYYCVECDMYLHYRCVFIPYSIKSKCHIHLLTLKDNFVEDDSGEYYCDICEIERNPKNHVYYCKECDGQFVAHIQCVLPTEEEAEPDPHASCIRN